MEIPSSIVFCLLQSDKTIFSNLLLTCYVLQASQAWMDWLMKKRKAFSQRGDMAIAAWAEQQQRELNVRVRQLSRSKVLWHA